jgi:hypothetical protein
LPAADKCVFEGAARDTATRLPVAKVSIHLVPNNGQRAGYAGSTNAAGAFHFENIEPGDYNLELDRTGYAWRLASKLHLAPGQTVDKMDLWLTPEGGVAGKVLGPDGEPLRGAHISLIQRSWWRGKRLYRAMANAYASHTGDYHIAGVAPGRYLVYASRPRQGALAYSILEAPGKPEMRIAGRYHPDAAQLEGAAPVEVRAGEEISGIDFRLPLAPVFHARGTGPVAVGLSLQLAQANSGQALEWTVENAAIGDGSFDIAGVAPGSYVLYSLLQGPGQSDRPTSAKVPVTIASQDVSGLPAPPVTRFDLKGRVRLEDGSAPQSYPGVVFCEGRNIEYNRFQGSMPKADGAFGFAGLPADRYRLFMESAEAFYLKSVRVKGLEAEDAEIDLTNGPAEDVELIVSQAAGSVEGTVKEPAFEATVVAVPEGVPSAGSRPRTAQPDQQGHFRIAGLAPGHYRAFAVTGYDSGLWQNAEFQRQMADRGTAFEVAEKGSAHVELPVVPAAEVRQVEDRIP